MINATNVQSGALWRFSRPYMADYRVGVVRNPTIELAVAVAASSAFPPMLSPLRMELDPALYDPPSGKPSEDLHREPFLTDVVLTDGGVYDNLGLETAWKNYQTILVSDGGGKMQAEAEPKGDWARHALRINEIIDNQVRSLRKRQVMASFRAKTRSGTYWGVRSDIAEYQVAGCAAVSAGQDPRSREHQDAAEATGVGRSGAADQLGVRDLRCRDAEVGRFHVGKADSVSVSSEWHLNGANRRSVGLDPNAERSRDRSAPRARCRRPHPGEPKVDVGRGTARSSRHDGRLCPQRSQLTAACTP